MVIGKTLSLLERKELYLEMMDEIDSFCRKHNIRYSLTCGTLIGAIRHKGFIPWDDDLDIAMPLPDMLKFKNIFKSSNLRYVDCDIDNSYRYPFARIESLNTYNKIGMFNKSFGLSIDLYPILGLPNTNEEISSFLENAKLLCNKRLNIMKWHSRIARVLPFTHTPILSRIVRKYRNYMYQFPFEYSNRFYHMGGYPNWKAVQDKNYFEEFVDVDFEGRKYMAVKDYDDYLRHGYGDYMQFPPEEQRHPYHGGHYFWKEKK